MQIVFFKNAITKGPTNGLNVKNASSGITRYVLGLRVVFCPAPSLDDEGSGDTRGFFVTDWNAISAEWAGFLSCNRKNDVVKLP